MKIQWEPDEHDSALHYAVRYQEVQGFVRLATIVKHESGLFHWFTDDNLSGWQDSLSFAKQAVEHTLEIAQGLRPEVFAV